MGTLRIVWVKSEKITRVSKMSSRWKCSRLSFKLRDASKLSLIKLGKKISKSKKFNRKKTIYLVKCNPSTKSLRIKNKKCSSFERLGNKKRW